MVPFVIANGADSGAGLTVSSFIYQS